MARNVVAHRREDDYRQAEAGAHRKQAEKDRSETIALIAVVVIAFVALCYAMAH